MRDTKLAGAPHNCRLLFKVGMMGKLWATGLSIGAILCGCASGPAPVAAPAAATPAAPATVPVAPVAPPTPALAGTHYRCERNIEFSVRFANDEAVLDAVPLGSETLLRDAGGVTPEQTVYTNARMRAEFGLGAGGREAILRMPEPPLVAHCVRDN